MLINPLRLTWLWVAVLGSISALPFSRAPCLPDMICCLHQTRQRARYWNDEMLKVFSREFRSNLSISRSVWKIVRAVPTHIWGCWNTLQLHGTDCGNIYHWELNFNVSFCALGTLWDSVLLWNLQELRISGKKN